MEASASTSVFRYRPAVVILSSLFAAGSIWYIYSIQPAGFVIPSPPLRRRGALRRRVNIATSHRDHDEELVDDNEPDPDLTIVEDRPVASDENNSPVPATETQMLGWGRTQDAPPITLTARRDEDETELSVDSQASTHEGERLKELVYAIAKHNHEREGIEHHGVTCDNCGVVPIVGPRYHCSNCPDFDLCEQCEATDCHLRTHVFFKVKIPAPWGGKDPLPLWYPGKPHRMPRSIDTETHRAVRATLSQHTGFTLSKIDGFYQQFTCMANVPFEDPFHLSMAIDRASFDHGFVQQVMTDKKLGPSLVADRLFALYDANKDGVIDFWEFVETMSLIHGKKPGAKTRRVFKGLDLDDDGFVSRKDFLKMFRSFYELNSEVLLGNLKAERVGENAEFIGTSRDVEAHIAGGRSLASYFGDGVPNWEQWPAWQNPDRANGKLTNEYNDLVLGQMQRSAVQREPSTADLSLSMNKIEHNEHLLPFYVFHDEMLRVAYGIPMHFFRSDQARLFEDDNHIILREADEAFWIINLEYMRRKIIYLRVEPEDFQSWPEWRDKVDDEEFCKDVYAIVKTRMCVLELPPLIRQVGADRADLHEAHMEFIMDPTGTVSSQIDSTSERDLPARNLSNSITSHGESNSTTNSEDASPRSAFVGGTAASHTISNVVTAALNELLDPIFALPEALSLEVAATASERHRFRSEIQSHLTSIYTAHWTPHESVFRARYNTSGPRPTARTRNRLTNEQRARLRDSNGYGVDDVDAWAQMCSGMAAPTSSLADPHESWTSHLGRVCVRWWLRLEADIWAEKQWEMRRVTAEQRREREREQEHENETESTASSNADLAGDVSDSRISPQTVAQDLTSSSPPPSTGPVLQNGPDTPRLATETGTDTPQMLAAGPDHRTDPTMPQHRPSTTAAPTTTTQQLQPNYLHHLTMFQAVAEDDERQGGPGRIGFEAFERLVEAEGEGQRLLEWVRGWVDLIIF